MRQKNKGKIIPNGVVLKTHESATVVFLTEQGYDIELIPKINIQGVHTPDIRIGKSKSIKHLKIITKGGKILDFKK